MQTKFLLNAIVLSALSIFASAQSNGGRTTPTATSSYTFSTYGTYTPPARITSSRTPRQSLFQAEGSASFFNGLITQADFSSVRSVLLTICPTPIQNYWTRDFPNIISAYALVTPAPDWITEGLDAPGRAFIQSVGQAERAYIASGFQAAAPTGVSKGVMGMAVAAAAGVVGVAMM